MPKVRGDPFREPFAFDDKSDFDVSLLPRSREIGRRDKNPAGIDHNALRVQRRPYRDVVGHRAWIVNHFGQSATGRPLLVLESLLEPGDQDLRCRGIRVWPCDVQE